MTFPAKTKKLFGSAGFIVVSAVLYYYFSKSFGSFRIYSITYFTLEQVRVLAGLALLGALGVFYGPVRMMIASVVGELLVHLNGSLTRQADPMWWLAGVGPFFFLPLFFIKFRPEPAFDGEFGKRLALYTALGPSFGILALFLVGTLLGFESRILLPQLLAYGVSSYISLPGLVALFSWIFIVLRKPRLVFLIPLTHHAWDDRDHTFSLAFGGLRIHFCTRCSGMIFGLFSMILILDFLGIGYLGDPWISPWGAFYLCVFLPMPGLIIWSGQKLKLWKSNTPLRLVNGTLLGMSIYMLSWTRPLVWEMLILLVVYFSIFYAIFIGGSMRQRKRSPTEDIDSFFDYDDFDDFDEGEELEGEQISGEGEGIGEGVKSSEKLEPSSG